ncbi:MAG TPA: ribosome biogenesis GTP-binding protein YihA/YsxC [Myxococcaceae bacterium]|nr:ribosome biogenesis GTP-binding protein YihA/YsxC [Myxococcaceae bacterium]
MLQPFRRAVFFRSVAALDQAPDSAGEIAFAGRSNTGKSSAINALTGQRLAQVSKTPGRTRLINYYALESGRFLVDLPGYGYAKVPAAIRSPWENLLEGYLRNRPPLRGLALAMDVRHPLTELDRRMLDWFRATGKPVHVLLTKADKLSREAGRIVLQRIAKELGPLTDNASVQLFSSFRKTGLDEARATFETWLTGSSPRPAQASASRK